MEEASHEDLPYMEEASHEDLPYMEEASHEDAHRRLERLAGTHRDGLLLVREVGERDLDGFLVQDVQDTG